MCWKGSNENPLLGWTWLSYTKDFSLFRACSMGNHGVWGKQLLCFKYNCEVWKMTSVERQNTSAGSWLLATCAHQGYKWLKYLLWGHTRDGRRRWAEALGRLGTPGATGQHFLSTDWERPLTRTPLTEGEAITPTPGTPAQEKGIT